MSITPDPDSTNTVVPRGTYGCACVSRDASDCVRRRYGTLVLGPQFDGGDEYAYTYAEQCECLCHKWPDYEDEWGPA